MPGFRKSGHIYAYQCLILNASNSSFYLATVQPRENVALARIFCRVASSTRWCLESTYFSIILTQRNCNRYTHVVLAIVQAKTTFVGNLHHYISSLLNTQGTQDLTNGCNSWIKLATSILEDSLRSHVMWQKITWSLMWLKQRKTRCLHGTWKTRVKVLVSVYNVAARCNK